MDEPPDATRLPARRRPWCRRLALGLASVAAAVLALELGLRLLDIAPPEPHGFVGEHANRPSEAFIADPDIGWRMRPGRELLWETAGVRVRYHANALGFRDDPAAPARPRARTIAVAGDSMSLGFGVPLAQSFGGLLARARDDRRVQNFAMPGFGLDQIWQCLRHYVLPRHPDLVIVGLVRDDFRRSLFVFRRTEGFHKPTFTLEHGVLRRLVAADRPGALRCWLERHSHLWTALGKLDERLGHGFGIGRWWSLNAAILEAMRADCAAAGVPVLFVHLPEPGEGVFPSLARSMAESGAAYVEPLDTPPAEPGPYHFADRHLNAAGHRWIAHAIEAWLRRRGW